MDQRIGIVPFWKGYNRKEVWRVLPSASDLGPRGLNYDASIS